MENRIEKMKASLEAAFAPTLLEIKDHSHRHRNHAGAGPGGHYQLKIQSAKLAGLSRIGQHRAIYSALQGMIPLEVHSLEIEVL